MGEAKRKRAARGATAQGLAQVDITKAAMAVRELVKAVSPARGADCHFYARYGQWLLQRLGVAAEMAIGYAAWRVGEGDFDMIAHHAGLGLPVYGPVAGAIACHAWVVVDGKVLDFTTHDLPYKAAKLDAADGRRTTVSWHPDFLLAEKHEIAESIKQVDQEQRAGLFYYERVSSLEAKLRALPLDQEALELLWTIYQNLDVALSDLELQHAD